MRHLFLYIYKTMLSPEIFKQNPCIFKNKILRLQLKCDKNSIK